MFMAVFLYLIAVKMLFRFVMHYTGAKFFFIEVWNRIIRAILLMERNGIVLYTVPRSIYSPTHAKIMCYHNMKVLHFDELPINISAISTKNRHRGLKNDLDWIKYTDIVFFDVTWHFALTLFTYLRSYFYNLNII